MKGATGKRINYFFSCICRMLGFIALLIAFIVVKVTVKPPIEWLNLLLLLLSIGSLISAVFNLILCGLTATSYSEKKAIQLICFIFTLCTGGIVGSTFTGVAVFTKVTNEELENENLIKIKGQKNNDKNAKIQK